MDVAVAMPCPDIAVGTSDSFGQLVLHNPKVKMTAVRMGLGGSTLNLFVCVDKL